MTCIFSSTVSLWSRDHFGPLPLVLPSKQCLINAVKALAKNCFFQKEKSYVISAIPHNLVSLILTYCSPSGKDVLMREEEISGVKVSVNIHQLFYFLRFERKICSYFGCSSKPSEFRKTLLKLNVRDICSLDIALAVRTQHKKIKYYSKKHFGSEEEGTLLIEAALKVPKQGCGKETWALRRDISPIFLSEDIGFNWNLTE